MNSNGAQGNPGHSGTTGPYEDALTDSGRVLEWLEQAWKWFVAMEDLGSARSLLTVIGVLVSSREELMVNMLEAAEADAAKALVEGL